MISQFNVPSTLVVGAGASRELVPQLNRIGARRVLLVTDAFMESSGLAGRLSREIGGAGIAVVLFAGVQADPDGRERGGRPGRLQEGRLRARSWRSAGAARSTPPRPSRS